MINTWTGTAEELRALGRALGARLRAGDTLALTGDLGAGKTTFVQGIGDALGVAGVQSPTFIVAQDHPDGRLPLLHVDLYRIDDPAELVQLGLEDRLEAEAVVAIEWADRAPGLLPDDHLDVVIVDEAGGRRVHLSATGPRHQARLEGWDAAASA